MKTKGFRCSLAFNKCRGSSSGSKAYLSVALIEPLESPLRALFGHTAVIEPLEGIIRSDKRRKKKNHKQGNVYTFSNDFSRTGNTLASRSIYPVINDFSRMGKNRRQKKDGTLVPSLIITLVFPIREIGVHDGVYAPAHQMTLSHP